MHKKLINSYSYSLSLATIFLLTLPSYANAAFAYNVNSLIEPTTIEGFLLSILNAFILIAIPIIVLSIIYAGFLYVTAKGNSEQVKQATTALTYSIIGGVIIIGAVAISQIVKNVVDSFSA